MGLLTTVLEITEELAVVSSCEGGMHLLMAVMAGIGNLYGSAGLHQLLHDSLQLVLSKFYFIEGTSIVEFML